MDLRLATLVTLTACGSAAAAAEADLLIDAEAGEQARLQSLLDADAVEDRTARVRLQTTPSTPSALRVYQRYTARIGDWELVGVAERDPGEPGLSEHVVSYAHRRNPERRLELAIGSLRPGFGQGLLFGRGVSVGPPSPRLRRESTAVGYRSATENAHLQGLFGRWRGRRAVYAVVLGGFRRDASVDSDGVVVSLPSDGGRAATRGALMGARVVKPGSSGHVGVTLQGLAFGRELDLRRPGKVAHGFAGRRQIGVAADAVLELTPARLFLEISRAGGRAAAVGGLVGARVAGGRVDLLGRLYDPGYFSPFGAAASGTGMTDERGVSLRYRRPGWLLWLDDLRRTSGRWTEPVPGGGSRVGVRWSHRLSTGLRLVVDGQRREASEWKQTVQRWQRTDRLRGRIRWTGDMAAADAGVTALRNGVDHGHAASLRGRGRARDVDGSIHVTGYRTDGYGARVYEYERSLPGSVSILPLYGTGWRATALIGLRRGRLQVWWRGRYEVRAGDQPRWLTGLQVDGGAR